MRKLLILAAMLFLAGPALAGYGECEGYSNGTYVAAKLSGLKGMVVNHHRPGKPYTADNCRYDVRFVTSTGWVYTIEKMRPYELKKPAAERTVRPVSTQPSTTTPAAAPAVVENEGLDFGG